MLALADDAALAASRIAATRIRTAHVDAVNGCRPPRNSRLLALSCTRLRAITCAAKTQRDPDATLN